MKMVKNPVIHEVLAKQYLRSILDINATTRACGAHKILSSHLNVRSHTEIVRRIVEKESRGQVGQVCLNNPDSSFAFDAIFPREISCDLDVKILFL